ACGCVPPAGPWAVCLLAALLPRRCPPAPPRAPQPEGQTAPGRAGVVLGGGCGVWAGPAALRPPLGGRADPDGVGRYVPDSLVGRCHRALQPSLPTDAGGSPTRSASARSRVCGRGGPDPEHRWTPTGERPRNALCRARTGAQTGLVCRGPPVQCNGGGPAAAGASTALGRGARQTGTALDVG